LLFFVINGRDGIIAMVGKAGTVSQLRTFLHEHGGEDCDKERPPSKTAGRCCRTNDAPGPPGRLVSDAGTKACVGRAAAKVFDANAARAIADGGDSVDVDYGRSCERNAGGSQAAGLAFLLRD
jgi:hypothetical protein